MTNYDLTPEAAEDLYKIWEYTVDTWSETQADKYYTQLIAAFKEISSHPDTTGKQYNLIYPGLRGYHAGKHIVFFVKERCGRLLIVRILHEKMDYQRHL